MARETVNLFRSDKEAFTVLKMLLQGFILRKNCKLGQLASQLEKKLNPYLTPTKFQIDHLSKCKINETIKYFLNQNFKNNLKYFYHKNIKFDYIKL